MDKQPTNTERLQRNLQKVFNLLAETHVKFPHHENSEELEAEFMAAANRVCIDLDWMDDRLTEKIIYSNRENKK